MSTAFEQAKRRQELLKAQQRRAEMGAVAPPQVTAEGRAANIMASPVGGFVRGLRDIPDAGAQLLTRGGESAAGFVGERIPATQPVAEPVEEFFRSERERVEAINREAEREYQEDWRRGEMEGLDVGRIAGNIAATAPIAYAIPGAGAATLPARAAQGAAVGTTAGVLQPVYDTEDYWTEKGQQAALGAAGGAVAPVAVTAASRVVSPLSSKAVQALREMGVTPTPGQAAGGVARSLEEKVASVPFVGEQIRKAEVRALEQFNRGAINHYLKSAGLKLPKDVTGREALAKGREMLSQGYDRVLPQMQGRVDDAFAQDISSISDDVAARLTPELQDLFGGQLQRITKLAGDKNVIPGQQAKQVISDLGQQARQLGKSQDLFQRNLGDIYDDLRQAFSNMMQRHSRPELSAQLRGLDRAYAGQKRVTNAATRMTAEGATEEIFTPAQLRAASKQLDKSFDKQDFALGRAMMQDVAEQGQEVLGRSVPNSGTTDRALVAWLAAGGYGAVDPMTAAGALGALSAYTGPGQNVLSRLVAGRQGPLYRNFARALEASAPALAAGAGAGAAGAADLID